MAGKDVGVSGQEHHFFQQALHQGVIVAAGEVGPSDGPGEERVSADEDARLGGVVADAAGGVSGTGDDRPVHPAEAQVVSVGNMPEIKGFHLLLEGKLLEKVGAHAGRVPVQGGHVNGAGETPYQEGDAPGMVEVTMGQQDAVGRQPFRFQEVQEALFLEVPVHARVHDGAAFPAVVPQNVTVGAQYIEGKGFNLYHGREDTKKLADETLFSYICVFNT